MRKTILTTILVLILLTFMGCGGKTYTFNYSLDKIESIEIVSAENSLQFTVIKKLSETEQDVFLEQFQEIEFDNYYFGDPMSVSGDAVKITYRNGEYEMISCYWSEFVRDGEVYFIRKSCDEKVFNELLSNFIDN